jgi:hypothetical protein
MVSTSARAFWEGRLGFVDWDSAIGGRSALIARAFDGPWVVQIDILDKEAIEVLKDRPEGIDTPITLYSLSRADDLSPLDSRSLAVTGSKPIALSPLYHLSAGVENLAMGDAVISPRQRLRLSDLPHLRALAVDWTALDLAGGYGAGLRVLSIHGYGRGGVEDLVVDGCDRIEYLSIVRSRALRDLTALGAFPSLSRLELYGCQQLADFSPLALLPSLRHLFIEGCRRLQTIEGVLPPNLETLTVTDCGAIDSGKPVASVPTLQRVAVNGNTLVKDLDLTPLLRLPALHSVLVASHRGYRPSAAELRSRFDCEPVPETS